jgi:hypothetical protein
MLNARVAIGYPSSASLNGITELFDEPPPYPPRVRETLVRQRIM